MCVDTEIALLFKCDIRNVRLSITHIIIERSIYNEEAGKPNVDNNLKNILTSITCQQKIANFRKQIKFLKKMQKKKRNTSNKLQNIKIVGMNMIADATLNKINNNDNNNMFIIINMYYSNKKNNFFVELFFFRLCENMGDDPCWEENVSFALVTIVYC